MQKTKAIICLCWGLGISCFFSFISCQEQPANEMRKTKLVLGYESPVILDSSDLTGRNGQLVTLRGAVSNSKIPKIFGVEVRADKEHRGKICYASGILVGVEKAKLEPELDQATAGGQIRGTLEFSLYYDLSGKLAQTVLYEEPKE